MPKKAPPLINIQAPLADNFFIFPTQGRITQGLHFYNAVDTANKCGTSIYAAASGKVQRVKYGYNFGGGNQVTILHSGGIVTYYGHLMTIFVKPGDAVNVGDRIALMGGQPGMAGAGHSTGCHLHFQVMGAKNPLAKYSVGTAINMK
jgi:murein DD-endopeptidase MepM/ murein hydrolase activator NlpD